jgi:4-alpha-glucanotransferase
MQEPPRHLPPLITAQIGQPISLRTQAGRTRLVLEDGRTFDGQAEAAQGGVTIPAILEPGYHTLTIATANGGERQITLAVAPKRGTTLADLVPGGRALALAAQIYALRRPGDAGIGDFAALGDFAEAAAAHGVQAIAISPVHAQFSADANRFAPYAPSSRAALNVLHAPVDGFPGINPTWQAQAEALQRPDFVDWPAATQARLTRLRSIFAQASAMQDWLEPFHAFRAARGEVLERHAVFEALHAYFSHDNPQRWHWRTWPAAYQNPRAPQVAQFAREYKRQVDFHAFLQFLADHGLARAQARARAAGMAIGLISDLAVGTDAGGSHCWSRPAETLLGLTVGAPPDMFQQAGQNWGLAAFSPRGLVEQGFTAFLEMLRAALAHAGGVRIDHSMGLNRLWVIPEGAGATEGAYLHFPETDLRRLIALESSRARAIVIAEDLGTLPEGFRDRLRDSGIAGMRVLWFERDERRHFTPPSGWTRQAAAMTTTHDLPTVAGWWQGRDIDWREKLDPATDRQAADAERAQDRALLWQAMCGSGAAQGEAPDATNSAPAVDAAIAHVSASACDLMILPIEDVLGLAEQPNLPNTTDEHPNWRRRLPGPASELLSGPKAQQRLAASIKGRGK